MQEPIKFDGLLSNAKSNMAVTVTSCMTSSYLDYNNISDT